MPKFKVRVLADATVYKEVEVETDDDPTRAYILEKALSAAELDGRPWLLSSGFQADQPYIGDADNDVEPVDEVAHAVPDPARTRPTQARTAAKPRPGHKRAPTPQT